MNLYLQGLCGLLSQVSVRQLDKESDSQVSTQNLQDTKAKDTLNWEWSSEPVQISSANFASNFQKTSRSRCKHKLV